MDSSRAHAAVLANFATQPLPSVVYGITALRYEGNMVAEVMMGMFDAAMERWELRPAPTRLVEVVDRLVEGDTVISMFPTERGVLQQGPEVKVDVLPEGTETLALAQERPGQRLADLPRF
ncbi:hypothetical protein FN976_02005 [Caenimonas sedimenti]|uniref:Uncharacterized protein n=1 Tax=Caenimonas sedimenti TaxID=2596921 RepID=A0A562ZWN9_9BURK|nr:hypothetical protein [Caenimonas sedimenti]TWO73032.1 hypothetical protein FN976_02005 [Caenimonas sedimenti]